MALRIALLVLCSVLLVACGGGADKDAYEQGLATVQAQLDAANEEAQAAAGDATDEARRDSLEAAHDRIVKAADVAESLEPPSDVEDTHAKLASALRDYADLFGKLAVLEDDDDDRAELYSEAGQIVERLDAANRELEKAGYSVKAAQS